MKFLHRLRALFRKVELDRQLSDEVAFHVEKQVEQNIAAGMSAKEARYAALRSFGGVEQVKEECRDAWGVRFIDTLLQDFRFGLRMLAKNPGFTAVAVLTLALGIGANTAIFSVVNAVLLRPLPYKDPGRLVWINESIPMLHANLVASPDYLDWQEQSKSFASLAAYGGGESYNLTGHAEAERIYGTRVSASFFPQLGLQPEIGRLFTGEEDRANAPHVALLTHGLWERRFGSDRGIAGQRILLNGQPYTVIGVMPASFEFPQISRVDLIVPFGLDPVAERTSGRMQIVRVIGRLKPGVERAEARAELQTIIDRSTPAMGAAPAPAPAPAAQGVTRPAPLPGTVGPQQAPFSNQSAAAPGGRAGDSNRPANPPPARGGGGTTYEIPMGGGGSRGQPMGRPPSQVEVIPLHERLVGNVRPALLVLLGAVGFVLLIACGNVANLLLARAAAREKEMVIRAALGAGRWRIVRQLLTESVVLALAGGALGLIFAYWGTVALVRATPSDAAGDVLRAARVGIDGWVLGFMLAASVVTGILFGLVPALGALRHDLEGPLKDSSRSPTTSATRHRTRSVLVVAELALALVLLMGAGLLMRSFYTLASVDPGFRPDRVLTFTVNLAGQRYASVEARRAYFDELQQHLRSLPGVESVSLADSLPLTGFTTHLLGMQIEGRAPTPPGRDPVVSQTCVYPEYFRTMGMTLVEGRPFNEQGTGQGQPVAIINQTLARHFLSDQSAVGKRYKFGPGDSPWITIIGVVRDIRHGGLDAEVQPEIYIPYWQRLYPLDFAHVAIRTLGEPVALAASVRSAVGSLDKDQPLYDLETMNERVATSLSSRRFNLLLLGLFAALALALAAVGIYGVTSYSVAQRTHEIGVRVALGARRRDVLLLVVGEGMRLVALGIGIGLVGALVLSRLLRSLLFGVSPSDPVTLVAVSVGLALVAALACYLPAQRATRVDPTVALRYE